MAGLPLSEAVKHGKQEALESLRDQIAQRIEEGVPARDLASLSKRLMEVMAELEELGGEEVSGLDEIARKRAQRLAATTN